MFSFHKPKIYRSIAGCCICRAKSSSSRFTDSRRYEDDFEECFQISELRRGEICNACVLLVKRWKKLAPGTDRNWRHVVDARAGPGTKSITKIKNRAKQEWKEENKLKKYKHRYQPRSKKGASSSKSSASCSSSSSANHRPFSPSLSDDSESQLSSSFLCHVCLCFCVFRQKVCCGIVYIGRGECDDILVDPRFFSPC
ncbi:hypothetical protein CAPTEDRAFT_66438, partial [Capitella teleta]|uniref:Protein FAM60A n=1 Tax=Capitella teleta TaxID=283909 RepID=X2B7I6_CAPTE